MQTNFKRKEYRNKKLIAWMHGKPCQVNSPVCDGKNTVPAHSNSGEYGKGISQKADDCACAIACQKCHDWLDGRILRGGGPIGGGEMEFELKRFYHDRAIIRTIRLALDEGILK